MPFTHNNLTSKFEIKISLLIFIKSWILMCSFSVYQLVTTLCASLLLKHTMGEPRFSMNGPARKPVWKTPTWVPIPLSIPSPFPSPPHFHPLPLFISMAQRPVTLCDTTDVASVHDHLLTISLYVCLSLYHYKK